MYFKELVTGKDIARFVERYSNNIKEIATTLDENPIQVVKISEGRKPSIFLKAGNHSSEIAGIHALLTLLVEGLDTPFETYMIPCGNPFDFGGYQYALSYMCEKKIYINSNAECLSILTDAGQNIYDGDGFSLFQVGEIIFAYIEQEKLDSRILFYGKLNELSLKDPHLRSALLGKRIFFPNKIYYKEDYGPYEKAGLSAWTSKDGYVSNLNRLYDRYDIPPELYSIREFCERLKPAMVIDLHESCINTRIPRKLKESDNQIGHYFLILPPEHISSIPGIEKQVAETMIAETEKAGFKCLTRDQLEVSWGYPDTDYFKGYVRKDVIDAMPFYRWATRFADVSITSETVMDMPIEKRIDIHTTLVRAALDAFRNLIDTEIF